MPPSRRYTIEEWAIEDILEESTRLKRWATMLSSFVKMRVFRSIGRRPNDVERALELGRTGGVQNGLQRRATQLSTLTVRATGKLLFASLQLELGVG
jgi:hypothetical protein